LQHTGRPRMAADLLRVHGRTMRVLSAMTARSPATTRQAPASWCSLLSILANVWLRRWRSMRHFTSEVHSRPSAIDFVASVAG
jgi:hypothetical protein